MPMFKSSRLRDLDPQVGDVVVAHAGVGYRYKITEIMSAENRTTNGYRAEDLNVTEYRLLPHGRGWDLADKEGSWYWTYEDEFAWWVRTCQEEAECDSWMETNMK